MEQRLAVALQRIGQADRMLRDRAEDPEPFLLIYTMGPTRTIHHPAWDISWPTPTAEDIDDLEELGYARNQPPGNVKRIFVLTVKGREQAGALAQQGTTYVGGRAPPINEVLEWLMKQEGSAPEAFDLPTRIVDRAVSAGFIDPTGREEFATRLVALADQGYLDGDLPDLDQATAEQRLGMSNGLKLTMKAHDRAQAVGPPTDSRSIAVFGPVIASQIAAGDIANYVTFGDLLDAAEAQLNDLEEVDAPTREEARHILSTLRGKALSATGQVATGAGGTLAASVIARLLGLPV